MSQPFWRSASCTVTVGPTADGGLVFRGHDLAAFGTPGHEYEYVVTVPAGHLRDLRTALDIGADADLLAELLARVDDIMAAGEARWLTAHGVEHHVSVWDSPPD